MSPLVASTATHLVRALEERFGPDEGPVRVARAPGRVNLMGDHTDYNDGFVLPMPLGRVVRVAARARRDTRLRLASLDLDAETETDLAGPWSPGSEWYDYVAGVARLLFTRGLLAHGVDAVIQGDVPIGSGLSSSAALEMATVLALEAAGGFTVEAETAARWGQEVEHEVIGVKCGIMDQFASRLGRSGHALFLDCRTLAYEQVPMALEGCVVVVVDSRAPRSLAASAYNARRGECDQGVAVLRRFDPTIRALRDVAEDALDAHAADLSPTVLSRCRHVVRENARVLGAVDALRRGDAPALGALMTESHASLRDLYDVSSDHLDTLVELASHVPGVHGSRLTGAGFGGCTVHLVDRAAVPAFRTHIVEGYRARFGLTPVVDPVETMIEAGLDH